MSSIFFDQLHFFNDAQKFYPQDRRGDLFDPTRPRLEQQNQFFLIMQLTASSSPSRVSSNMGKISRM